MTEKREDYILVGSDRRKNLRVQLLVLRIKGEAGVEGDKNVFFGYAKNLSRSGMFISTVNPRRTNDEFDITFKLPDGGGEAKCRCRVMWTRDYNPKTRLEGGMGIHFIDLDGKVADRINDWAEKEEEERKRRKVAVEKAEEKEEEEGGK
ncbi:MAG: PilZ domain-containing protein [Thermodesulfobacteriota bacterium]